MVVVALTVGELVAYAQIDKSDFQRGTKSIAADLKSMQSETSNSMQSMETSVTKSLADIEASIADGLDPASAIADLDRLEKALNQSLDDMVDDADRFAAELEAAVEEAFADLDDDAKESGKKTGKEFVDGVEEGVGGTASAIRRKLAEATSNLPTIKIDADSSDADVKIANVRESLQGLADQRVGIDVSSADALAEVQRVKRELEELDRMTVDPVIKADIRGTLDELSKVESALGVVGSAAETSMGVIGKAGPANVALVIAAIVALPAVASIAAAGIVAAIGGGLLAVGFKVAASSDEVKRAWSETVDEIKAELADAAQPFEGSAIRAADVAGKAFDRLKPSLKRIFADLVPDVDHFVEMTGQAVGSLGPTLERLGDSFGRVLSELGDRMPAIIDNISAALTTLSDIADEDPQMLANLLEDATELLSVGAEVLSWADEIKLAFSIPFGPAGSQAGTDYFFTQIFGGTLEEITADMAVMPITLAEMRTAAAAGAAAISNVGGAGDEAAGGVRNFTAALKELFDPAAAALDAEIRLKGALEDAAKAAKDKKTTDVDRLRSVQDLTRAIADAATAENDRTGKTTKSSAAFAAQLPTLTDLAGKNTAAKDAVVALGNSLGVTIKRTDDGKIAFDKLGKAVVTLPNGKTVKVDADTAKALAGLKDTKDKTDAVKDKKVKVDADTKTAVTEVGKVKTGLDGLKPKAEQAGKDVGSGLSSGIRSMIGDAIAAAKSLAASALQGAKDFLGIKSPSTVMAEVGKWTVAGLVQGLNDNKKYAVDTVKDMVSKIKEAFKSEPDVADGLIKFVSIGNDSLSALAKQRDELVERLANAKEMAKQVAGTAQEWADITGLKAEDFTGAGDIAENLQNKASAINNFANNIKELARRGLNKKVIQDIIDAGVEKGATFAEMLVGSDGSEIKALNKAQAQVDKAAKKLGKVSADAMYDTGKKAGDGYLKGLEASLKDLDKAMKKIVDALVKAIKKELKIKSPSQVMAEIGQQTMAGLAEGITSATGSAVGAITGVASSLVSAASGSLAKLVPGQLAPAGAGMAGPAVTYAGAPGTGVDYKTPPGGQPPGSSGGVNVSIDMSGVTVREEADIHKIGSNVGFHFLNRGNV